MGHFEPFLQWIDSQAKGMEESVLQLARINSGSMHVAGLARCLDHILDLASPLTAASTILNLPPWETVDDRGCVQSRPLGKALSLVKRPKAPLQVFLGIHMDTVFDPHHPFQHPEKTSKQILKGPGVADAKGGIVILLKSLEALEQCPFADQVGWEVLINPDEEIASPGSSQLFPAIARRCHLGLLFEPATPSGKLIAQRKGSGNFTLVIRGRAAHAGRNPQEGRNAIDRLAEWIQRVNCLNRPERGWTINVAQVTGGGPRNVIPDLAIARFNIRFQKPEDQPEIEHILELARTHILTREGYAATLHGSFGCPPKVTTPPLLHLRGLVDTCSRELGTMIEWEDTGGVCDGNRLAGLGLPNIDNLGARGGGIHSDQEYLELDSLVERTRLCALLLMKLAKGELEWPF